jgi:hypothetical protein
MISKELFQKARNIIGDNNLGKKISTMDRFSFSLTVHKSQGSTYDNVIIDIHDILEYGKDQKWRLLYVAA